MLISIPWCFGASREPLTGPTHNRLSWYTHSGTPGVFLVTLRSAPGHNSSTICPFSYPPSLVPTFQTELIIIFFYKMKDLLTLKLPLEDDLNKNWRDNF